jgi:PAS domain S-box-containing protein
MLVDKKRGGFIYSSFNFQLGEKMKKRFSFGFNTCILITLIILSLSSLVFTQEYSIRFTHIGIEHGLSQSSIYCMMQGDNGFMWFGTEAGLNRYNGYDFDIFLSDIDDPTSLSHSYILAISKDRAGNYWVGTERGLNLFNKKKEKFTRYNNDPNNPNSLSDNRVLAILEDSRGFLWVGTDNGLNRFNREEENFQRFLANPENPNSLSHNFIQCIYEDKSGQLWIGTRGGGLNRLDRKNNHFIHYKHEPKDIKSLSDNSVLSITEDSAGILWIGTEHGGLNQLDIKEKEFKHYKNDPNDPNSLSDDHVNVVFEDKTGVLWVGTNDGGLNIFDRKSMRFIRYQNNPDDPYSLGSNRVLSIYEDNMGGLWFGNYGGAINIYNRQAQKFIHYQTKPGNLNSLSYNDVRPIYEDRSGILWIGTDSGGLNKFDRKRERFTHYQNKPGDSYSLSDNRVFAICEDFSGVLWIGTNGGGLNRFHRQSGKFYHYQYDAKNSFSLSDNRIRAIREDRYKQLWIGTNGGGLNRYEREKDQFIHYKFDPQDPNSLNNDRIYCIYETPAGVIWVGTFGGGLNRFLREENHFIHYTNDPSDPRSIGDDFILSIHEDKEGTLWVGTLGGGLNKFDPHSSTFSHYTEKDGLPNNVIYDILEDDDGNLWMSTNKGLSKFNPKSLTFKNYDMRDGLQSNEFNTGTGFRSKMGEMFFGGINGFNSFFPDKVKDNPFKPQIVITAFQLFNKSVPIGEMEDDRIILQDSIIETQNIVLSHTDKAISFEYAALHYASPDKNMYAYMMEGFETDWNYVGDRRFVTYTGLPPGEYVFKVKGSNNDGIWNEIGKSLNIIINPPFWKTLWFYAICILVAFTIAFGIYRLRVRQLKTRKEELEDLVKERTSQLGESNKQLEEANDELKTLSIVARETDNAVIIMDAESNIEWVNEGFTRMFEDTLEQLIKEQGKTLIEISSHPDIRKILDKCINEKEAITYESPNTTRSGRTVWAQTTLTPILNEEGKVEKLVAIESDITKIKEAEMAADRANQSKSEFLARMSHEIRTPMNGVIGFSDMLLDTSLTAEQMDYARTISRSGEALITLLNDILDFSKIEAGELTFDPIDFDPEVTVFDVCDIINPRLENKHIELICRIGDSVPAYVRSDAGRFRQVIVNLMGNAAKFTEEGEIELSLDVEEEDKERYKLHIKVRDTGIGIPESKLKSVFDVFQQADGSTTRKYGGTGLGLTISKQISNLMGGDVWVESAVDRGSIFHFTCWVNKSKKESEKTFIHDYLTGKKVLIVDDNPTNLEILSHALELSKMRVTQLKEPMEVIPVILGSYKSKDPFHICIIDIQMPEFSGYDLAKEIRNLDSPVSKIPLLAFSSSTLSRSKKYRESGFDGFLPKPIRRKKLLKMVERLLGETEVVEEKETQKDKIVTQHTIIEESKHSVHILLAEDNPINLKLALFMLTKAGYQVSIAKNGDEVITSFLSNPDKFDLILMDIQMPVVDGREATKIIRGKGFVDIPIIAMTAESMKGDREKCLEAGMDDYISKPIKRDVVFKMVKKWCLDK